MRTIGASMQSHIEGVCTSLSTIWKITRKDGTELFFTDHDVNIVYDGDTYLAATGFERSAMDSAADLSVDSMDVAGIISSGAISEDDLLAGAYDGAVVMVGLVNWADPSMGRIALPGGVIGEITLSDNGIFKAEILGLVRMLDQHFLDHYQAECRADLGDTKCKIPVYPDVLGRNAEVNVGEFYRVPTLSPTSPRIWTNLCANPSFEVDGAGLFTASNQVSGWDHSVEWGIYASLGWGVAEGTYQLGLSGLSDGDMGQNIDLVGAGIEAVEIDAGDVKINSFYVSRGNHVAIDQGRVRLQYLDEDLEVLNTAYDSGWEAISPIQTWVDRGFTNDPLPTGTRYIRIILGKQNTGGGLTNGAMFDNVRLEVQATNQSYSDQRLYENRHYEVTDSGVTAGSQPTYDETPGATTVDGTATLICRQAWARDAEIDCVIDQRVFTVRVDESRAVDDWFKDGVVVFETGETNHGQALEIKEWTKIQEVDANVRIGKIELFRGLYDTIYTGQQIRLYVGCTKAIALCHSRFDNVENFRGEPHLPGTDSIVAVSRTGRGGVQDKKDLRRGNVVGSSTRRVL